MTHSTSSLVPFSLALTMTFGVACGQKDEPSEQDYNDVALALGSTLAGAGEVSEMGDMLELSAGETPAELSNAGSGTISGVRGGLSYSFAVACRDLGGTLQESCDASTDHAAIQVDWSGSFDGARLQASVDRSGDWTLSHIQSGLAQFDGDGTFTVDSNFTSLDGNRTRSFHLDYAANYDQILIDTNTRVIEGGVASFAIAAQRTASNRFRDVEAEFDIDAVVTFLGNGTATLQLDGSRSYQIDLSNGSVSGL